MNPSDPFYIDPTSPGATGKYPMQNRDMIDCPMCGAPKGDACRTFNCGALKPYQGPQENVAVVKPFTPEDARKAKVVGLPNEVIEAVNELLAKHYSAGGMITIMQEELENQILQKFPELTSRDLVDRNWLDIEEPFRQCGWDVRYDKPGYNESYDAFFEFRPKRSVR